MARLGYQQIVCIILLNLVALWLTYGYLVAANPLTIRELRLPSRLDCRLLVYYPERLVYGERFSISGMLACKREAPPELIAQALLICGDIHTLTVNASIVKADGTFNLILEPDFPKPSTGKAQCSLTVHIISKTVSMGLVDKKTLTMVVPS
jgi:hypothetical protein